MERTTIKMILRETAMVKTGTTAKRRRAAALNRARARRQRARRVVKAPIVRDLGKARKKTKNGLDLRAKSQRSLRNQRRPCLAIGNVIPLQKSVRVKEMHALARAKSVLAKALIARLNRRATHSQKTAHVTHSPKIVYATHVLKNVPATHFSKSVHAIHCLKCVHVTQKLKFVHATRSLNSVHAILTWKNAHAKDLIALILQSAMIWWMNTRILLSRDSRRSKQVNHKLISTLQHSVSTSSRVHSSTIPISNLQVFQLRRR